MWNPKDDDDSWEIRAFEEDTSNSMGSTWPPRFYTCTFCRREFRSAQALGGHMNVHRRDRVRLNQTPSHASNSSPTNFPNANSTLLIQNQEFIQNGGGLCYLYSIPNYFNPNPTTMKSSPSNLLSNISPFLPNHLMSQPHNISSSSINTSEPSASTSTSNDNNRDKRDSDDIDLELRLGWRSATRR